MRNQDNFDQFCCADESIRVRPVDPVSLKSRCRVFKIEYEVENAFKYFQLELCSVNAAPSSP
jgi:hypothetical protein